MTPCCSIDRLGPADLVRMHDLLTVFGEAFEDRESYGSARPGPDYLGALLQDDTFVALVAMCDATVVGGLVAYELRKFEQVRSEFYIYDLAVDARFRRRGIATALIDALKPIAARRGGWMIFVQADPVDAPAVALYAKLGRREDVFQFDIVPA